MNKDNRSFNKSEISNNITEYEQRFWPFLLNEDQCNCSLVSLFKKHLNVVKAVIGQCCITKKLSANVDSDTKTCFCFTYIER